MKIRKAVIPVAGLGTRFLPATKASPKEMLALVDKPLIQYAVEEAATAGIEEIILVTGVNKGAIEDHFRSSQELENFLESKKDYERLELVRRISGMLKISSVIQKEPKGLGHAILQARKLVGGETFAVLLPDDVHYSSRPVIGQLIDVYEKMGAPVIAVERVPDEKVPLYGVIDPEPVGERLSRIKNMVEKPTLEEAPSNLTVVGRYVLTPVVFDYLEKVRPDAKGEIQLTEGLNALRAKTDIYGYEFEGERYDAGDKIGFLKATVEFALRHHELKGQFRAYLKSLKL
ncbi:UTP--glucose-1-phosphate uridylyltransferase [hydrothermal vent metagenome]|uniref:UTP--glucose-1-phosphate uridylyltransferase n=1 Tax=hydrothermal vent metagenome TaxID=652676 RepID=A0A3B1CKI4_9ZZZZ